MSPSLDDLALLAAVARHRGFRKAAAEAGLSPSGLSERIRALEDTLGARLLNRTTRSVSPTEAGEALLARIAPALADIEGAVAAVGLAADAPVGRLRINAPDAAEIALGPLLGPFMASHPGVTMEVVFDNAFTEVVADGFDAGIRYGEALAKDMIAVPLGGRERFVLVAAPSLIAQVGMPAHPDPLRTLPAIRLRLPGGLIPWEFEKSGEVIRFQPQGRLTVTSADLGLHAARDGLGFFATFEAWACDDLASGRLIAVLDDWQQPFDGPFLYYPSRRHPPPALKAFVDFLRARQSSASEGPRPER